MVSYQVKVISIFASVLALTTVLIDNTDTQLGNIKEDFLQKIKEFELSDNIKEFVENNQYFCINGKDPQNLNALEQLEEFKQGPCAPLTIMPGVLGTTLQAQIDCEVLQRENPAIFANCGWSTCSRFNIFGSRPAAEYRLWVGDILSKTKILQTKNSKCFGDLISLAYNEENNKLEDYKGIHVTFYGNTPETRSKSECGASSIKNFSDNPILKKSVYALNGFRNLIDVLTYLGYQSGITFQALPYDFRQSIAENETKSLIKDGIDNLYSLTGKKTVMIGHSLGCLHTLDALSTMSVEYKDQKIKQFIAIGPPFIGAPKGFQNIIGGDSQYIQKILGLQVGINFYSQIKFSYSSSSTFDLLPKNTFDLFKGEPWLNELIQRIEYEKNDQLKPTFSNIFPDSNSECINNEQFTYRKSSKCQSGLQNLFEESVLSIEEKEYKSMTQDTKQILNSYSYQNLGDNQIKMFNKAMNAEGLLKLKNPQVPTAIIYGGMLETIKSLKYNKNPKSQMDKNDDFYFPEDQETTIGDGTVPSYSAITPGFKWAYEYENGYPNSKPIKIIEYCSKFNNTNSFYETNSSTGEKIYTKNSYSGLECECESKKKSEMDTCTHSTFINDKFVISTIFSALQTNETPVQTKSFTLNEIELIQENCPVLYK